MKMHSNACAFLLALILGTVDASGVKPANPIGENTVTPRTDLELKSASQFVVVDQGEPAFIVFTGIPKDIDKEQLEIIKLKVSGRETLTMLTWEQFLESVDEYARSVVLRNDYPNFKAVDGIVCLVDSKKGSGAPWGLTWNGGIALTFNDYQHVRRTYKSYKANSAAYRPIKDPRRDPVNPGGFLPFFGCSQDFSAQAQESSDCKLSDLSIDADIPRGYRRVRSECPKVVYVKKLSPTHALGFNVMEIPLPHHSSNKKSPAEAVSDYVVSVEGFIAKAYKGQSYNTQRIDENADYPPSLIDQGGACAGLVARTPESRSGHEGVRWRRGIMCLVELPPKGSEKWTLIQAIFWDDNFERPDYKPAGDFERAARKLFRSIHFRGEEENGKPSNPKPIT